MIIMADQLANFREVQLFKMNHANHGIVVTVVDKDSGVVRLQCDMEKSWINTRIPYGHLCLDPFTCAGHGSCPRNYACSE